MFEKFKEKRKNKKQIESLLTLTNLIISNTTKILESNFGNNKVQLEHASFTFAIYENICIASNKLEREHITFILRNIYDFLCFSVGENNVTTLHEDIYKYFQYILSNDEYDSVTLLSLQLSEYSINENLSNLSKFAYRYYISQGLNIDYKVILEKISYIYYYIIENY